MLLTVVFFWLLIVLIVALIFICCDLFTLLFWFAPVSVSCVELFLLFVVFCLFVSCGYVVELICWCWCCYLHITRLRYFVCKWMGNLCYCLLRFVAGCWFGLLCLL